MDNLFEITKIINNIKGNDYTVGDYKMCQSEAEFIIPILENEKAGLEFDKKYQNPIGE